MQRLRNWPSRFAALVEIARALPFSWGSHDCCLWAASGVLALTGQDPARAWRGTYTDALGATRLLDSLGGLSAVGSLTGVPIEVSRAVIGDVGLVTWPDGTRSLGVCAGHSWMCAGEDGLNHLALEAASEAWGVGHE